MAADESKAAVASSIDATDPAAQATPDPAAQAWELISALVFNQNRREEVAEALGLSFGRSRVLRRLVREPLTLRELAARLNADPPYVTLMVDGLEERGLVQRSPHPTDRRAKLVHLTDEGRAAAERAVAILKAPPQPLRDLPPDELVAFLQTLEKLAPPRAES